MNSVLRAFTTQFENLFDEVNTNNYKYYIKNINMSDALDSIYVSDTLNTMGTEKPIILKGYKVSNFVDKLRYNIEIRFYPKFDIKNKTTALACFELELDSPNPSDAEKQYGGFNKDPNNDISFLHRILSDASKDYTNYVNEQFKNCIEKGLLHPKEEKKKFVDKFKNEDQTIKKIIFDAVKSFINTTKFKSIFDNIEFNDYIYFTNDTFFINNSDELTLTNDFKVCNVVKPITIKGFKLLADEDVPDSDKEIKTSTKVFINFELSPNIIADFNVKSLWYEDSGKGIYDFNVQEYFAKELKKIDDSLLDDITKEMVKAIQNGKIDPQHFLHKS